MFQGKHILMVVENLPLPFDRRVWQEANTLKENGAEVSIICPKMKGYTKSYECINGIHIYRHPLPLEARGAIGYIREYGAALFWEFFLSWKIFFKKRFHVIQGCNPPDLIFIVALFFRIFGVKYVFDHHDINPELYIAKYNKKGMFYKFLLWAERLTFMSANYSIATNESYRDIAIKRGKMPPEKVTVVRSGPKLDRLKITPGNEKYKKGRKYLVGYVGVIGEQEGIDLLLESARYITAQRQDVQFAIVGGGTDVEKLKKLSEEMGLSDYVDFYGRVDDETLVDVLNTADICVNPDKPTVMNNLSTMNKIMEYMALKKAIVQYDLKEGRVSAQGASLYATNTDTRDFAQKMVWLLDNEKTRKEMGEYGYQRIINELSWDYEKNNLVNFYKRVFRIKDVKEADKKIRTSARYAPGHASSLLSNPSEQPAVSE
ncbi:MAG: glycosyltransferase family 4 protein [Chitinophagaceae bacterium]|nr:glycosyltransferase family 4 protein [Chitinophagaceae bacterium]